MSLKKIHSDDQEREILKCWWCHPPNECNSWCPMMTDTIAIISVFRSCPLEHKPEFYFRGGNGRNDQCNPVNESRWLWIYPVYIEDGKSKAPPGYGWRILDNTSRGHQLGLETLWRVTKEVSTWSECSAETSRWTHWWGAGRNCDVMRNIRTVRVQQKLYESLPHRLKDFRLEEKLDIW